ncbi:sirohydrochlorin chelatase [Aneurinibacillus aneurinilyticus]|uniref:Sirohydrochlorin cobaltochelatase n=1 Tax=Aneurinibacillus aneurinilyticus ATCC 12856 TaxID=649747 RepID=U1YIR3_ANEAE|nr:CbiX/SirB N-terminal domain-containing protein [Aneurinibacillus aneurinilyticus]ERI10676.1 sirohydrochlorin cobaltochelatase [Aneurinibacillus aneurinilyticus ATCC 12856]MED0708494.1 CbiX/SirB N-terminal domain-containing protein [Aneurinibacillus aneurinilyticus]MED0723186.1 CbiX/SirB N-terminal domain-containing protein [Aneurinibacillus aneurinilyticus]MED0732991.1 CbiX/SirB N-terminal domain-containing protein [Aneurinibacillus aneurinilyticus]MED0739570.1 CbiX/SirB N-terminal domain-c
MKMRQGVLVISHGSRSKSWVQSVDQLLDELELEMPLEAAFLDMVEDRTIGKGIERLEAQGVEEILAVPLFVSSGSTHLAEIQYVLGLVPQPEVETELQPLPICARIIWTAPMDSHEKVHEILCERIQELSVQPEEEIVMLAAHGSDAPGFRERWQAMLERLAIKLQRELGLKQAIYGTFHPDTLRERACMAADSHRLLVIPLFLSPGYYTEKMIPKKLEQISHVYNRRSYLPDPKVAQWLKETITSHLREKAVT